MIPRAKEGFSHWCEGYRLVGERELTPKEKVAIARPIREARSRVRLGAGFAVFLVVSTLLQPPLSKIDSILAEYLSLLAPTAWVLLPIPALWLVAANYWWLGAPQQDLDCGRAYLLASRYPTPIDLSNSSAPRETHVMLPLSRIILFADSLKFLCRESFRQGRLREVADPPPACISQAVAAMDKQAIIEDAPGKRFAYVGSRRLSSAELEEVSTHGDANSADDMETGLAAVCLLLISEGDDASYVGDPDWEYYHDFTENTPSRYPTRVAPIEILPHSRRLWTAEGVPAAWRWGEGCWSGLSSFPDLVSLVRGGQSGSASGCND